MMNKLSYKYGRIFVILAFIAFGTLFSACGDDNGTGGAAGTAGSPATPGGGAGAAGQAPGSGSGGTGGTGMTADAGPTPDGGLKNPDGGRNAECKPSRECETMGGGPKCGTVCCKLGESCDMSSGTPTCKCGQNPSCGPGLLCVPPVRSMDLCAMAVCCDPRIPQGCRTMTMQ